MNHSFRESMTSRMSSFIGKKYDASCLPSFKGVIETVHSLPGRMRLHVPMLVNNPEAGAMLGESMERIDSISSVQSSTVTGSVVIRYDPAVLEPIIVFGATARLLGLEERIEARPQPLLWREFKMAGNAVNNALYQTSAGVLDLKTLVALGLIGTIVHGVITRSIKMSPPGVVTMSWWAYQHLFSEGPK